MTRQELLNAFTRQLRGVARMARADMHLVDISIILYIREYIRHQLKIFADPFEPILLKWMEDEVLSAGNYLLRAMSEEEHEGSKNVKERMAKCIMDEKIILRGTLKQYKRFHKRSAFTFEALKDYNHAILVKTIGCAFLNSLGRDNLRDIFLIELGKAPDAPSCELQDYLTMINSSWTIKESLTNAGLALESGRLKDFRDIEYHHYTRIPDTSYPVMEHRCGLQQFLR